MLLGGAGRSTGAKTKVSKRRRGLLARRRINRGTIRFAPACAPRLTSDPSDAVPRVLLLLSRSAGFCLRRGKRRNRRPSLRLGLLGFLRFLVASQLSLGHARLSCKNDVCGRSARYQLPAATLQCRSPYR